MGAAHPGPGDVRGPGLIILAAREAPGPEQETQAEGARGDADRGAELAVTRVKLNQTEKKHLEHFLSNP